VSGLTRHSTRTPQKRGASRVGKAQRAHAVFESGLQESIMSGPWLSRPQSLRQLAICASAFALRGHAALCPPYKTADSPLQRLHALPAAGTDDARRPRLRGRRRHGGNPWTETGDRPRFSARYSRLIKRSHPPVPRRVRLTLPSHCTSFSEQ